MPDDLPHDDHKYLNVSPLMAGLLGRCPRCGKGALFKNFLSLKEDCSNCGLSYHFADSGDGPAVFIILIVGFLVVGMAMGVEIAYQPPYWVHVVLWLPLTAFLCLGLLRPFKATLIALQFKNKAEEGRREQKDPDET